MCSSSPVRTPNSQLAAEQASTGEYWIPPKKDILCARVKVKPQQDNRRGETVFGNKPHTHPRCSEGTGPRDRSSDPHRRLSHTCLWVFECLLQRHRSVLACCRHRGSGYSRPERHSMGHKFSWSRLPLAPLKSCWADNPQSGEQLYQRSSHIFAKVLGPTTDFPTWGSSRDWEPPGNLTLKGSGIWLQNFHRTGETDSWKVQTRY